MRGRFKLLFILLIFLTGCAAQTTIRPAKEIKIGNAKTIAVKVATGLPDCQREITQIRERLMEKLKNSGLFEEIYTEDTNSDLILRVDIEEMVKVTKANRFWYGALAGRGKVAGRITIIEGGSGKTLGQAYIESITSGGSVFAGTTEEAIENFTEKVMSFIEENMLI